MYIQLYVEKRFEKVLQKTSKWPTGTVVGLRKLCEGGIFLRDTAI